MTEDTKGSGPVITEDGSRPGDERGNGAGQWEDHPLLWATVSTLVAERHRTALAGLGLIAIGVLYALGDALDLAFSLWSLLPILAGSALMVDAWRTYDTAGYTWVETRRNEMIAGALIALIGLVALIGFGWWDVMLLVIAGWLAVDAWQRYRVAGNTGTASTRSRGATAAVIAAIGLVELLNLGGTWLLLIAIGGVVVLRHVMG